MIWFAGLTVVGSVAGALWPGIFKLCRSDVSPPEEPVHRGIEASDNPVFPSSEPSNCRVRLSWGDREARVRVGEAFSIHLQHSYSTGHMPWEVSQTPSFINRVENYVRPGSNLPGAGNDYVFVFEANGPGRGEIFMQQPCLFNASRTEQYRFSIIAE